MVKKIIKDGNCGPLLVIEGKKNGDILLKMEPSIPLVIKRKDKLHRHLKAILDDPEI